MTEWRLQLGKRKGLAAVEALNKTFKNAKSVVEAARKTEEKFATPQMASKRVMTEWRRVLVELLQKHLCNIPCRSHVGKLGVATLSTQLLGVI